MAPLGSSGAAPQNCAFCTGISNSAKGQKGWRPGAAGGAWRGVLKQRGLEEGLVPARPLTARRPWISLEQISFLGRPWAACWPVCCQNCPYLFLAAT